MVYIQLNGFQKENKEDIVRFIKSRLTRDLQFSINDPKLMDDGCIYTSLNCSSRRSSIRLMNDLIRGNSSSHVKIITSLVEFQFHKTFGTEGTTDLIKEKVKERRNEYVANTVEKIRIKAEKYKNQLDSKTTNISKRIHEIEKVLSKSCNVDKFQRLDTEQLALKDQKEGLRLQLEEFLLFIEHMHDKLQHNQHSPKFDQIARRLHKEFSVECLRLENALPIYSHRSKIVEMIEQNQVSIVLAETGSGKSTQIVQYLRDSGKFTSGKIVCTQPRKIAAISIATRVALETGTSLGQEVGFKVGMYEKMSSLTEIVYMTDGALLNECLMDKTLKSYSCIVLDEAHERSIYTDLLLGLIKECLNARPELRVVVTSATIDPHVFVEYFGGECAKKVIGGRCFPVDIEWMDGEMRQDPFSNYYQRSIEKAVHIHKHEHPGDVLVFLTSPLETERACTEVNRRHFANLLVLPLNGRLQSFEQQKVFDPAPEGFRKIVFATNSAETSVTIPGVKYVIDSGMTKEMQYDTRKQMNVLSVIPISKSSADQRKGRAGRTSPGKCYRLYSEEDYHRMAATNIPEILRIHISHAVLKLFELNVNPAAFDYVESPSIDAINHAMSTLEDIGAVQDNKLTPLGRKVGKLPLEPCLGAFVFKAIEVDAGIEGVVIAAASNGSPIFFRSGSDEQRKEADKRKIPFCHEKGDIFTMLNVFREWHIQPERKKGRWSVDNSINGKSMKSIRETSNEILHALRKELKINIRFEFSKTASIEDVLVDPLFHVFKRNIGYYLGHPKAGYIRCDTNRRVQLHPSSSLHSLAYEPRWMFFQSIMQTTNDFAMNVTPIDEDSIKNALKSGLITLDIDGIQNKALEPIHEECVGNEVFSEFVGYRYEELKLYEQQLITATDDALLIVDADRSWGTICLWFDHQASYLSRDLVRKIDAIKTEFKHEQREERVGIRTDESSVRIVLSLGASTANVFMPDEYKTVMVHVNRSNDDQKTYEIETIKAYFKRFGKVRECKCYHYKAKNPSLWGQVTFEKTEDAVEAVRISKEVNSPISVRPNIRLSNGYQDGFNAKVEWCRRRSTGVAFVAFCDITDCLRMLGKGTMLVGGSVARVGNARNSDQSIRVLNLGKMVTEDVLRDSILSYFEDENEDIIEKVTIVREKVVTTAEMLTTFHRRLCREIERYVPTAGFKVTVVPPKGNEIKYRAFVNFVDPEQGEDACRRISNTFLLNEEAVTMCPNLSCSVQVRNDVLKITRNDLDEFITELESSTTAVRIRKKELRNGNIAFDIRSETTELLAEAKRGLQDIIGGQTVYFQTSVNTKLLFSHGGKRELDQIMSTTKTLVIPDSRSMVFSVYGKDSHIQRAIVKIDEYLKRMSGTEKRINLKEKQCPPGSLKAVLMKFGLNLQKLRQETGLTTTSINLRNHYITLLGSNESVEDASAKIREVLASLPAVSVEKEDEVTCSVCFTEVEDNDTLYRLEACGHAYDHECLKLYLLTSIEGKDIPLKCVKENCNQLFLTRDIFSLQKIGMFVMKDLVDASLGAYVIQHQNTYHYCITPDCPVVYRIAKSGTPFVCPECSVKLCTNCHVQFHNGLSCRMYKSEIKVDDTLERWMRRDVTRRKNCPLCTSPIEKQSGCNKMQCGRCKTIFCWLCLDAFRDDQKCYKHLQEIHGGFGGGYDYMD